MIFPQRLFLVLPAVLLTTSHSFTTSGFAATSTLPTRHTAAAVGFEPRTTTALSVSSSSTSTSRLCRAQGLMTSLIEDSQCYATTAGAQLFGDACAVNVIYDDCYEPQPIVGKQEVIQHMLSKVAQRNNKGTVRIDRISDGDQACGFAWTWVTIPTNDNDNDSNNNKEQQQEGLRGTTFVQLNESGEIQYVREIPEPIFKPGDATIELLKAVTAGAVASPPPSYETKTPTIAHEIAQYLFCDVQGSSIDEAMRFFADSIQYRDFNYDNLLLGRDEVRKFIEDFSFPGITFRPQKFDDGHDATCFTWEVVLEGAPETIKGISYYELSPETRKIVYVRDVPESAIKPPILGKLARQLRPGR